mgnify:CR=1 FL=1
MTRSDPIESSIPLVIAVTGHRDLVPSELAGICDRIRECFKTVQERYPERRLQLISGLAEGADRLAADVALQMGVELVAALPMEKALYRDDFVSAESQAEFESLCDQAVATFELPVASGNTAEDITEPGEQRSRQYAQLGVFLSAHCHVLLAIWDGKVTNKLGGTGQVVEFHHDDVMPGYTPKSFATQQMLIDDESDLVYHVVCSRDRVDGKPQEGLQALDWSWYTKDANHPRSKELPEQHELIFERESEFSREMVEHAAAIEAGKYPLYTQQQESELPPGVAEIDRLFCAADWLAIRYQNKVMMSLRITHILAFLMGLMFILYTDGDGWQMYMFAFLVFFMASAAMHFWADRSGWHRKYLDYRTLAEGLRVQFYWAVAAVSNGNISKYMHDNFLQSQDPELGWIRNVMRVSGTHSDAKRDTAQANLDFVLREWIGSTDGGGQLGYFLTKGSDKIKRHRLTERLGLLSLLTSVVVVLVFVVAGSAIPATLSDPLLVIMGTMLLVYGIRQGFGYATAEKDLVKQYEFMFRLFQSARTRLDATDDPDEQRKILRVLGGSALDEHADWILMHRERAIDRSEIWRMGS